MEGRGENGEEIDQGGDREWGRVGDRRKRREWRGDRSGRGDREWGRVGDRRKRREWRGERSGRGDREWRRWRGKIEMVER